jgi:hypothetical protein
MSSVAKKSVSIRVNQWLNNFFALCAEGPPRRMSSVANFFVVKQSRLFVHPACIAYLFTTKSPILTSKFAIKNYPKTTRFNPETTRN